jgi:hypothetical protein
MAERFAREAADEVDADILFSVIKQAKEGKE